MRWFKLLSLTALRCVVCCIDMSELPCDVAVGINTEMCSDLKDDAFSLFDVVL